MLLWIKTRYINEACELRFGQYANKRIALQLLSGETGERAGVATVNLVGEDIGQDEAAIKDYSENEGMVNALLRSGIIHPPHRVAVSGFVEIPICRWTDTAKRLIAAQIERDIRRLQSA